MAEHPDEAASIQAGQSPLARALRADAGRHDESDAFALGVEALRANRIAEAIELLTLAAERDPANPGPAIPLGIALQAAGRHAEALARFEIEQASCATDAATFLHSAISHLALNDPHAAIKAASEACWRAPKLATAHYVYGQAWTAVGDSARAEQAFATAIQLSPSWADAWVNYGLARYARGALDDAKTAMRQALAATPGHAAALSNLGAFLRITGESETAERLLADASRAPDGAGARLNLAVGLLQEERAAEALALLDEDEPANEPVVLRHWLLQRCLALIQLQRFREARETLDRLDQFGPVPASLWPLIQWRLVLLALAEGDSGRALQEAERMEAALSNMGADAVLEHAVMARFDLAKFWSGQGAQSRAFAHWTQGHNLLKRTQPFSREAHRAFVDASIAAFSAERMKSGARASNLDPAPVFVVGMPRSGTTLVEQILAAHRDAHGAGERAALGRTFAALGGPETAASAARRIAELDSGTLDLAAECYLSELHAIAPGAKRIVDKMPGNFLYLGLVGLTLPSAKIIYCERDPRDIGLSIFSFRFHGSHGYAHDLGDLGWYIGEQARLMSHWRAASPLPILTVRLSDWVNDFDATLARVLAHLDLPPDANCARFYDSKSHVRTVSRAQVRQPVNSRGLGRWKAYAAELKPLIVELEQAGALDGWRTERGVAELGR